MQQTATERVAANVRAVLAVRHLTWTNFAASMGWSSGTMSRRLNGNAAWQIDEVQRAADVLGVPVDALMSDPTVVVP